MLNILVDTCVWFDLAKDPDQRPLLAVLREQIDRKKVRLVVPRTVLIEVARNKARIVQESGRSLSSVFKRVNEAVEKFGDTKNRASALQQLNDLDHRIPHLGEAVNDSIREIESLINGGDVIEISDSVKVRAAQRAIDRVAPFHRQRNGIDDAILIEVYTDECSGPASKGHRFAFVTHNTKDFSDPAGDNRTPHPDLISLFSKIKSRFFTTLVEAMLRMRPDVLQDMMLTEQQWVEEPRPLSEILSALDEMVTKVWYDRHCVLAQQIDEGKHRIVDRKMWEKEKNYQHTTIDEVWNGAMKSARRVERKYGKKNLGPWSKFEWGMLNGKVSALRWVLGEDWDDLYT